MANKWENIADMPKTGAKAAPSLLCVQKRWIYQVGGTYGDNSIYRMNVMGP